MTDETTFHCQSMQIHHTLLGKPRVITFKGKNSCLIVPSRSIEYIDITDATPSAIVFRLKSGRSVRIGEPYTLDVKGQKHKAFSVDEMQALFPVSMFM